MKTNTKPYLKILILLSLALSLDATAGALSFSTSSLDRWIDRELGPYLAEQLATYPRFKGESVALVAMDGAEVTPEIDELTLEIRRRLTDRLLDTQGVNLVWRPASPSWETRLDPSELGCREDDEVHYYIGIEVRSISSSGHRISVRALDLEDRNWVTGFGRQWEGSLSRQERAASRRRQTDEYLRGLRALPFNESEPDLIAAYLAENMSCLLQSTSASELVVYTEPADEATTRLRAIPELVGNYLGQSQTVQLTDDRDRANVILRGRLHSIDNRLHQFWLMVRPREGAQLPALDTDAYVQLDRVAVAHAPTRDYQNIDAVQGSRADLISPLRIAGAQGTRCSEHGSSRERPPRSTRASTKELHDCVSVELDVYRRASVFLLHHPIDARSVELLPADCELGGGRAYRFSGPGTLRLPAPGPRAAESRGGSDLETFYALAVSDAQAAQKVEAHLNQLPANCMDWPRHSMSPREREAWLTELDVLVRGLGTRADWQAIRIRHATDATLAHHGT